MASISPISSTASDPSQGATMLTLNAQQQRQGGETPTTPPSPSKTMASSTKIFRLGGNNNSNNKYGESQQVLLGVNPQACGRKLSLQPLSLQSQSQYQQQHQHHHHHQQPLFQQYILLDHHQPPLQYQQQFTSIQQQAQMFAVAGSSNNLLGVNNPLRHRKSLIGRLERSSFQAQRLSDVGVSLGQQITAKMGLKLPASQERIVEQTRWLYLRYVFLKLRQNKLPLRDLNLTKSSRARRAAAMLSSASLGLSNHQTGGYTIRTQATTSLSAPGSASITNTLPTISMRPPPVDSMTEENGEPPVVGGGGRMSLRKRTAVSGDLDGQQLSMLTARVQGLRRSEVSSENLASIGETFASATTTTTRVPSQQVVGGQPAVVGTAIRKYVMDPTINNQIFSVILDINRELRDWKPEFYGDTIYELIGIDKFSSLETLLEAQMTICQEMTRQEISWCRITALFSLFGAMSLDCVRLGAPEHVGPILDGFIQFVERDLALWISQQGGWESFLYKYQAGFRFGPTISKALALSLPFFIWAILSLSRW